MDKMEKYKIQESIKDVVSILDSAPIHRDLIPETTLVQLTNRIPIAHLAIERGLKALITEAGGTNEHVHSLNRLYRDLKGCDRESADFLALAFNDAVGFFRYNVKAKGFGQFRSLDDYLTRVGTDKAFEALRYWAIGETSKGESPIPFISPIMHREILCAMWCLFLPNRREVVSERVERRVRQAMSDGMRTPYMTVSTDSDISLQKYLRWINKHSDLCTAFEGAARRNFIVEEGDERITQALQNTFTALEKTKDPAVRYFIKRLTYLPEGSQKRNPDAIADVEWLGQDQTRGIVKTPAGTYLGFIEKYVDGAWGIEPQEEGLVKISDIAESLADAKAYLVNRLTRQVTVAMNGESRQLRIVTDGGPFALHTLYDESGNLSELSSHPPVKELEFWDVKHGIDPGVEISIELPDDEYQNLVSVLKGTVTTVIEHRISVAGTAVLESRDEIKC